MPSEMIEDDEELQIHMLILRIPLLIAECLLLDDYTARGLIYFADIVGNAKCDFGANGHDAIMTAILISIRTGQYYHIHITMISMMNASIPSAKNATHDMLRFYYEISHFHAGTIRELARVA